MFICRNAFYFAASQKRGVAAVPSLGASLSALAAKNSSPLVAKMCRECTEAISGAPVSSSAVVVESSESSDEEPAPVKAVKRKKEMPASASLKKNKH